MAEREVHTRHFYRKFENGERYSIDVAINNYNDIFNEWDPAPFKRRDMHPELQEFLDECSNDISLKHGLAVVFYMPNAERDPEKETFSIAGMRNFFAFKVHILEKEQAKMNRGAVRNFVIGLGFLVIAVLFEQQFTKTIFTQVFGQGLFIGGWVFIWEAVSTIVFKNVDTKHKIKEWQRFLDAPIVFMKESKPEPVPPQTVLH